MIKNPFKKAEAKKSVSPKEKIEKLSKDQLDKTTGGGSGVVPPIYKEAAGTSPQIMK
jgi:hypothetical protein